MSLKDTHIHTRTHTSLLTQRAYRTGLLGRLALLRARPGDVSHHPGGAEVLGGHLGGLGGHRHGRGRWRSALRGGHDLWDLVGVTGAEARLSDGGGGPRPLAG